MQVPQPVAQAVYAATAVFSSMPSISVPPPKPTPTHETHHNFVFLHGHRATHISLWVFFAVFLAGTLGVATLAFRIERRSRIFHVLAGMALAISTTAYLMLATGIGMTHGHTWDPYHGHHGSHGHGGKHGHGGHGHGGHGDHGGHGGHHHGGPGHHYAVPPKWPGDPVVDVITIFTRQTLWARSLAHVFTAPLFVAMLGFLSGMAPLVTLLAAGCGAMASFAALVASHFDSWTRGHMRGYYVVWMGFAAAWAAAMFAYLFVPGIGAARLRGRKTQGRYYMLMILLFIAYVSVGVLSIVGPGLNVASVDVETIVVGILDVATQVGFVYFLIFTHVHDDEDPSYTIAEWLANPRGGTDGRGQYSSVSGEAN